MVPGNSLGNRLAVLAVSFCCILLAACGDSPAPSSRGIESAGTDATTTTTVVMNTTTSEPSPSVQFTYTDPSGWTYSGTIAMPSPTLRASTDISSSPPGEAQFKLTQSVSASLPTNFSDTNPGRPDGPPLSLTEWIAWGNQTADPSSAGAPPLGTLENDVYNAAGTPTPFPDPVGPCYLSLPPDLDFNGPFEQSPFYSYGLTIYCKVTSGSGDAQYSASQSDVTAAVQSASSLVPDLILDFGGDNCEVLMTSAGQINQSAWNTANCGAIQLSSG
jgi:hypothetical protein